MSKSTVANGFALIAAALFLVVAVGEVAAGGVEDVFAGKVIVLKKKPPSWFRSKQAFVKFLRSHSTRLVYENEDHTWSFETMAFFRRPLGDYEVDMVFYDVEAGSGKNQRRFVDSYAQNTMDRNTRSLSHKTHLTRPQFDAKIRYMITVQSRGRELAKGFFETRGVSQAAIDQQKRLEHEMKKMEKSMRELEEKARRQQEEEKKRNDEAAGDLF